MEQLLLTACLIAAFGFCPLAVGVSSPIGVLTISSVGLLVGTLATIYLRVSSGKPIAPKSFFSIPIVIFSIAYVCWGVGTGFLVEDRASFTKEVVQRCLIILAPMYVFSMAPKRADQIKKALFVMLPICTVVVLVAVKMAKAVGFSKPVYVLGMHKNQIAGTCAVMGVMAIACLLTSNSRKKKYIFGSLLVLGILGCAATQGRAGLICMVVSTIFMLFAIRARWKTIIAFVLTIGVMGALIVAVMPKEAIEHATTTKRWSSNGIRIKLYNQILPELLAHPLDAVGWGQLKFINGEFVYDGANVILFDWMQMGLGGAILLLGMIVSSVWLPMHNATRMPTNTLLSFVNLVSLGIIVTRFTHGMLDTFWIGRGVNLTTWMAIGICIYVKLLLDQNRQGKYRVVTEPVRIGLRPRAVA